MLHSIKQSKHNMWFSEINEAAIFRHFNKINFNGWNNFDQTGHFTSYFFFFNIMLKLDRLI